MTPSMIARSSGVRCERSGMSSMAGAASRERCAGPPRAAVLCPRRDARRASRSGGLFNNAGGANSARHYTDVSAAIDRRPSPTLKRRRQFTPFLTVMRAHFFLVIHLSVSIYNFLLYQLQIIRNFIINCYRLRLIIFFYFIHVFLSMQRYITEVQSQSRGGGTHSPGKWFTRSLWNRLLTPSLQGNFFERMRIYS